MLRTATAGLLATALATLPLAAQRGEPLAVTPEETVRLRAYHFRIVQAANRLPARASLAELYVDVMQLAEARSTDGSAVTENRTALLAVAFYANGRDVRRVVPDAAEWPAPRHRGVQLHRRSDLAQHFTVSAARAAAGGAPLADLIGLYKEMDDARRGSGFSFPDLAADRAGSLFGDLATRSPETAERLQAQLAAGLPEHAMMPGIDDLPEGISSRDFDRRYGNGSSAYRDLVAEIDRRIAALALFQAPSW